VSEASHGTFLSIIFEATLVDLAKEEPECFAVVRKKTIDLVKLVVDEEFAVLHFLSKLGVFKFHQTPETVAFTHHVALTGFIKLLVHRFEAEDIEIGFNHLDDEDPLVVDMLPYASDSPGFHQENKRKNSNDADVEYKNSKCEENSFANGIQYRWHYLLKVNMCCPGVSGVLLYVMPSTSALSLIIKTPTRSLSLR
jgi:hypothetical protein